MKFLSLLQTSGMMVGLMSVSLTAQESPEVGIESIEYQGSGCPNGSVGSYISADKKAMTLMFDDFTIATNGPSEARVMKNCLTHLKLSIPAGWSYTVFGVDVRGYAELDSGITGVSTSAVGYSRNARQELGSVALKGPVAQDYTTHSDVAVEEAPWSACSDGVRMADLSILSTTVLSRAGHSTQHDISLASNRARPAEIDLGVPLQAIRLVKQISVAPCILNHSFGVRGNKAWVNYGCRANFKVTAAGTAAAANAKGLMTVDTIDGELQERYGLSWKKCELGQWVQVRNFQPCEQTCRARGWRAGADSGGAQCTSGEARPSSAVGNIQFTHGCPGNNCSAMGNLVTKPTATFCYARNQRQDFGMMDMTVACYCLTRAT